MKLVINVPDYIKEQADDGKGEEFGIPLWLAYEIANVTPLDKIRAEITSISINGMVDEHTMFVRTGEQVKKLALDIIDKHRESEE